jgi:hypothetical protein
VHPTREGSSGGRGEKAGGGSSAREVERLAAEVAAQKAEEEAKEKARRMKKAMEVVGSGSDVEPRPLQKKGKAKARAESVEAPEESSEACQQ